MRRLVAVLVVGFAMAALAAPARAQVAVGGFTSPMRVNGYYAAPGLFGMAYGSPSVGMKRTYTEFASPYPGGGYGYGYAPYGMLPGRFGVGLWRPGFATDGYVYGASYYYRTFPVPYTPGVNTPTPPVGAYAPGLGPGLASYYSW
jgi:hypothetical protein